MPPETPTPPEEIPVRVVPAMCPIAWVHAGMRDFSLDRGPSLMHGLMVVLGGWIVSLLALKWWPLLPGAFSGFVYNHSSVTIYVDYVYHPHLLTTGEAFALTWYLGGGAQVIINDRFSTPWVPGIMYSGWGYGSVWFAARVPIGVSLTLAQAPLEVFLEAAPSVLVFPVLSFGVGGAIGMRFYL